MVYIKIIGLIILIASGTSIGFYYSEKLNQKKRFWEDFLRLIIFLKTEINYKNTPICESLNKFYNTQNDSTILKGCLKNFENPLKSGNFFDKAWNDSFKSLEKNFCTNQEINHIINFGINLGKTDTDGQLRHLDYYYKIFNLYHNSSIEEAKIKGKLYRVLGVSSGFLMAIIFF